MNGERVKLIVLDEGRTKLFFGELLEESEWGFTIRTFKDGVIFKLNRNIVQSVKILGCEDTSDGF